MGVFVITQVFDGELREAVSVSFTQMGVNIEPAIVVGREKTEEIAFTKGSYELMVQNSEIKSFDFAFIEQGFLFKGAGCWSIIPLTEKQFPKGTRKSLVVFKKPQNFEGDIAFELEGSTSIERVISGFTGTFNECAILIPQGKVLKITYTGKSIKTFYLIFDGRELKLLTWSEVVFGSIRRLLSVLV